ncbi:3-oxoacyl-[acyl-carrier-protein] reductase FabG [Oxobacter pfennigii]|uniref:3-oxoacyl-[acyl-carrier-protein] reductase FabG n=1 Tax=Oxobacter pfennigii TaxID=36849 RepID=A0A0P8WRP9_9CLOT|nr:SDR family oxidoreductase [Oxobacter pfennigii]KPU45274.1 3-oxoacyl-[acyl-carrier-protein] reductase FabG [Oxobacter pfennigii]
MNHKLTGFYAVITGASDGFGFEMSRTLLLNGATVAMASRPGEKLNVAAGRLQSEGLQAFALPMDVRSEQSVDEAVSWVKKNWGHIDLLVNNAGLGIGRVNPTTNPKLFFEIDPDGFRDVVETNFTGYFLVARGFAPMMVARRKGRIVNVSTSHSTMVNKGQTPYGPSRAGAEALSNIMTAELSEYGITVNVLLPGGAADTGLIPEGLREEFRKRVNLLGPDVMNEAILFLASPLAEGMTGERIIAKDFHQWLQDKGIKI